MVRTAQDDFSAFDTHQKLQFMLDHIPQSVYWQDRQSKLVWCNRQYAREWGVDSADFLVGKTVRDSAHSWTSEQAEIYLAQDRAVMETGKPLYNYVEQRRRPDGSYAWLNTHKVPLFNAAGDVIGLMGTSEDITDRADEEIALRHNQQILETIFKNVPIAILWKDRESRFVGCNDYFARHAGMSPQEIVGLTDYDMPWKDTFAAEFIADDVAVMESREPRLQYIEQFQSADGTSDWIQTNKVPLEDSDGNITGIFITYQDVTRQVAIGEELNKVRTAAQEEKQRLARDLHDAVSQTLWTASIIADILPNLWERDQAKAHKNLNQLRQLTRGALAEMRMLLLELRPDSLLATSFKELLEHLAAATMSRKEIDICVETNQSVTLSADTKLALYRIAQECLNNVSKHSKASKATITVTETAEMLRLVIADNGRGFDPTVQTKERMGLSILQERAAAIGAQIDIQSQRGHGTTISVCCPLEETG